MARTAGKFGRRELIRSAAALGVVACSSTPKATAPATKPLSGPVSVWSWFDLPANDPRSGELSGIAWDGASRTLWAVQDKAPRIIGLHPDERLEHWSFGEVVEVGITGPLDMEGLVLFPEGFIIASEEGPRIVELDNHGNLRGEIPVPSRFRDARTNKSLESLTMSPDGRFLFTTSEGALERDGALASVSAGTRVRILRLERHKGESSEHVYTTDPATREGGDYGVADLAAVSDEELLVLERGWAKGEGNSGRIYRTTLDPAASCLGVATLPERQPTLAKTLVTDLSKLVAVGVPASKQPQPNALMDNYEGLAIGPTLHDGRPTLIVVSDDNGRSDQYARILVLAFG